MPLAEVASKTFMSSSYEELPNLPGGKTYVMILDLNGMQDGDEIMLFIDIKIVEGGDNRTIVMRAGESVFHGENGSIDTGVYISPPIPAMHSFSGFIGQSAGPPRSLSYSILSLD